MDRVIPIGTALNSPDSPAVKRLEYDLFKKQDDAYELKHHFWKF